MMRQQGQILWEIVRLENRTVEKEEGQDSGASRHYIQEDAPITISQKQDPVISVGQPGGAVMTFKYNCVLNIHSLPNNARKG
eukprot:36499-Ditylum_brightwellii.AAC.2